MVMELAGRKQVVQVELARRHATLIGGAGLGLLFALPLAVYARTLAPAIYNLDSPDLAAAAHTLGIAHAPGYPLYTLLGWLFSHAVPLGDVGYRLNLMSALLGAGTVLLVYLVARRLTGQTLAAVCAALLLGFSHYFWADSLIAEVYTLDTLLLAGMLLLLLRWRERQDATTLFGLTLLLGLSLANRTTSLLFAPAIVLYLLWGGRSERGGKVWLVAPAGVSLGLLVYLYVPLAQAAGPAYSWASFYEGAPRDLASPGGLWWLVSAAPFQTYAGHFGPSEWLPSLADYGRWLTSSFVGVGVVLGLLGAWRQLRTSRREFVLLAALFLPQVVFYTAYSAPDREFMFLPTYVIWALWAGVGVTVVGRFVATLARDRKLTSVVAGVMLLVPLGALVAHYPQVDLSSDQRTREEAVEFLALAERDALVVGPWIDVAPMQYLQVVEGERTDIGVVHRGSMDNEALIDLIAANVEARPVYVFGSVGSLVGPFDLVPVGGSGGYRILSPRQAEQAEQGAMERAETSFIP